MSGNNTYLFQEINAWKYEKESLRRVFLKQLWQGISGEKLKSFQEIQRIFPNLINNEISQEKTPIKTKCYVSLKNGLLKLGRNLRKYCLPAFGIVLFTIIVFIFYKLIQAHTENVVIDGLFWWKVVLSYCKNIGITLLLPVLIALLTALHNEYRKKEPKNFELKFPLETADDYELFLESAIADKLKDTSNLKIVTIIDDLDRLSPDKIIEALDSIKAFVNLPNCVFIVPFDDEIIKSALEKQRKTQFGKDFDVIESELILDKLFQFKIYLPPLLKYDIKQYAINLAKREIPDFITDHCAEEAFNRLMNRVIDITLSTEIVNELIVHEYEKNSENIHSLLKKLKYIVDDENAEAMTAFTANYTTSALMDDVLVYLGSNGYFPFIETTLNDFIKDIFSDENNDELLGKISRYFTNDVRTELFDLLSQKTVFSRNNDYARELAIIAILSIESGYNNSFEPFVTNILMTQFASHYNQPTYFDFILQSMGVLKGSLQQTVIDDYINKLISYFPSRRTKCLDAFERLTEAISKESMVKIFPLVTTNITDSEFVQALKILMDNDNVRPTEANDLTAYREFLISHLDKCANPNMVLQTLKNSFEYFSKMKELTVSALSNNAMDKNLLVDVIAKCLNNYKDVDKVTDEVLPMFDGAQEFNILQEALKKQDKHSLDDIFAALIEKLNTTTSINTLVNIAEYATKRNSTQSTALYLKALVLGLERDNVPDKVVKVITTLSGLNKNTSDTVKNEIIASLHLGFTRTTSESILLQSLIL